MKKVKMIASGRVQGVGFRWTVLFLAREIGGIYGRVWNNEDGTVTILAQSHDTAKLNHFIQTIRKGPTRLSRVTYLDVTAAHFESYQDFQICHK